MSFISPSSLSVAVTPSKGLNFVPWVIVLSSALIIGASSFITVTLIVFVVVCL